MKRGCGTGACFRPTPTVGRCEPGHPQTSNDGWASERDPVNDSWDTNCDGKIEKRAVTWEAGNPYVIGCASTTPVKGVCAPKTKDANCGDGWLPQKCELVNGQCKSSALGGAMRQHCR